MERPGGQTQAVSSQDADPVATNAGAVRAWREGVACASSTLCRPICCAIAQSRVLIVGAGGTGSAIVMGLPYLDQAMRVWGHRYGLDVAMMDADTVSETNCVRQPFSASDIGQNKATVLINRINCSGARTGRRSPVIFMRGHSTETRIGARTLLIGCVDTRAARKAIEDSFSRALKPDLLLARPRQQCGQRAVCSRPASERAQPPQGGPTPHGQ